jgi:hypothetical protein
MKNTLQLLFFCIISWNAIIAQRPWVSMGTQWQLINHQNSPWAPQPYYAVCTDTVLKNGIWCSEIKPFLNCVPMSSKYQYLYEQDRRVYFDFQGAFYLIFDHNKVAGESYTTYFVNQLSVLDSVTITIDSVFTNAAPCPTQVQVPKDAPSGGGLALAYTDWIVEGQGYIRTIFPEYQGCDPVTSGVLCFYAPGTCHNIPCIVPTTQPAAFSTDLQVFPNPGTYHVCFDTPLSGMLKITDMTGELWHQTEAVQLDALLVNHLPNGLYIMALEQNGLPTKWVKWVKMAD